MLLWIFHVMIMMVNCDNSVIVKSLPSKRNPISWVSTSSPSFITTPTPDPFWKEFADWKYELKKVWTKLNAYQQENEKLRNDIKILWSQNQEIKSALIHSQKNILALTSYVQKSQTPSQNEEKSISSETMEEKFRKVEESFDRKIEVIDQKLDAFLVKIQDNSEAHLTDYGTLMGRINGVEDMQASCCILRKNKNSQEIPSSKPPAKRLTTTSTLSTTTLNTITTSQRQEDSMDQETVAFCVQHESMQKTNNATLKFDSIQFVTHTSVNMLNGTFTVPKSGFYSFSIFYTTRLCGALSLCGPTVLRFYKNEQILRTFSRDLATDAKADQDMVSSTILTEASIGDTFFLHLTKSSGQGISNLQFCGWQLA